MTKTLRRVAATLLLALAVAAPAAATDSFGTKNPSAVGNYLAGQQAIHDLRTADAAKFFKAAAGADWDNPLVVERAFVAYAANGQIEDAATAAKHLLELDSGNEMARIIVASEAIKQRRYPSAIKELEQLGSDSFEGITGSILKAWAYTGDGRIDQGFKELDALADGSLEDFLVFHRAVMADVAGRSADAIQYASQAYDSDPYVARIVEAYARMLGNAGRFDDAIDVVVNYEAQGLTHPLVNVVKESLARKQRPGLFAATVQAGAAEMFHSIGMALAREGSVDVAIVYLQLARYLDPAADIMAIELAQLYDTAGQNEVANAIYDSVPANSPLKAMATVRVADNLDVLGNRPEAIRRLSNIVTSNPDDIDAISVLGDLLNTDKRYADAAATYSKALAAVPGDAPGDWRFYYARGIAFERDKKWAQAEADFLKALDLSPDQPQVLNYLGYSWVDQGTNLQRALAMIQKAVAASPNDGYIIDSLGWAYYRLGRFNDAVAELEQAVNLRPTDPEINDHLGDAYWRDGRKLEARFQWNIASAVDKDGDVKKRVAPKLAGGLDAVPTPDDSSPIAEKPASSVDASAPAQ